MIAVQLCGSRMWIHKNSGRLPVRLRARFEPGAGAPRELGAVVLDLEVLEAALQTGVHLRAPEALAAHEPGGLVAAGAQALGKHDVARIDPQRPADDAAAHAIGGEPE